MASPSFKANHPTPPKPARAFRTRTRAVVDDGPIGESDIVDDSYLKDDAQPEGLDMAAAISDDEKKKWWHFKDDNIYVHNGTGELIAVHHSPADARVVKEIEGNGGGSFNTAGVTLNGGFKVVMETMHDGTKGTLPLMPSNPGEYTAISIGGSKWALLSIQVVVNNKGIDKWHCFQQLIKRGKKISVKDPKAVLQGPPFE